MESGEKVKALFSKVALVRINPNTLNNCIVFKGIIINKA